MSRPHHKSDRDGYGRDDKGSRRDPRDSRTAVQYSDAGSRTPVRTTTDGRPSTDPRSMSESRNVPAYDSRGSTSVKSPVDPRDPRDPRSVLDSSRSRDPRDAAYGRDPRIAIDPTGRDTRTAPPAVTRDPRDPRDSRRGPEETSGGGRSSDYFLPAEDINREVITTDVCKYLGPDALVRPYVHKDGRKGYLVTAYRPLTSAMILSLKQDSKDFESKNRKREREGHRAQQYNPSGHETSRGDRYGEDRNSEPMARGTSHYANEPEPRRSRAPASYDDDMDIDPPQMDPRYAREGYDSRSDPRARPAVSAGYAPPGRDQFATSRDQYGYDGRSDPRVDPRAGMDPRAGYAPSTGMDYPMTDSRAAYTDPRGQPVYAPTSRDPYATVPAQASAIPRGGRDEPQMYIDRRTGQPVMVPSRAVPVDRHASSGRPDVDMDYDASSSRYRR